MPTGGWLSTRFGRKRVFTWAIAGFTVASVLCGAADTLTTEVVARILQGASGAFLIPLSQAIVLDTYPLEQHGKAMALWGGGAVMGTMLGPTVGGYLTEYLSWRYIYYINVPFGLLALLGVLAFVPETQRDPRRRLDWFGFLTLALGIGALQMMLDRGQRLDWFASGEIIVLACLGVLGLYLFAVHSVTARDPFLDPRLVASRKFFLSLLLIACYGFMTVPVMVLMPTFLEHLRGYADRHRRAVAVAARSRLADGAVCRRPHQRQDRPAHPDRDRIGVPGRLQRRDGDLDRGSRGVADRLDRLPARGGGRHHAGADPGDRLHRAGCVSSDRGGRGIQPGAQRAGAVSESP